MYFMDKESQIEAIFLTNLGPFFDEPLFISKIHVALILGFRVDPAVSNGYPS